MGVAINSEIVKKMYSLKRLIGEYDFTYKYCGNMLEKYNDIIGSLHVGSRQYEIIHFIVNKRCNKVSELAKLLDLSNSSLSLIITKMTDNNLIVKHYDTTDDSRNVILEVTKEGQENYNILKNVYCEELANFINTLNDSEQKFFIKALYSLTGALAIFNIRPVTEENTIEEIPSIIFQNLFTLKIPFENMFRDVRNVLKAQLTLTEKETKILMFLNNVGISTPSEVAKILQSSESTISIQLKKLLKKGHLVKTKCKEDSRKNLFYITDLGKETVNREFNLFNEEFIKNINNFSEQDKINILDGLNNLHVLFELLTRSKNDWT